MRWVKSFFFLRISEAVLFFEPVQQKFYGGSTREDKYFLEFCWEVGRDKKEDGGSFINWSKEEGRKKSFSLISMLIPSLCACKHSVEVIKVKQGGVKIAAIKTFFFFICVTKTHYQSCKRVS